MKRVVFCWEMGSNYGHIAGFLPIYRELIQQGAEVFFIVRELRFTHLLGESAKPFCFQAPSPAAAGEPRGLFSFGDILAYVGYLNEPVLTQYLAEWCDLLAKIKPDVMVVDHAPTALLAARALAIPATVLAKGFNSPPFVDEFPYFFPQRLSPLGKADSEILSVVNLVLKRFGARAFDRLGDLFSTANLLACTFAELDHYGQRDGVDYLGTLFSDNLGSRFDWQLHSPDPARPRIFAYLTPQLKNLPAALAQITQADGYKLLHLPNVPAELLKDLDGRPDISIHQNPVHMGSVLSGVDLVISQGGLGVSSQCLLAGIKHLVLPTQTEQRMLARRLVDQSIGFVVDPNLPTDDFAKTLSRSLAHFSSSTVTFEKIDALKAKYANFSQSKQTLKIVQKILSLA